MGQAVFRYYSLAKDVNEKKSVMSTIFLMTLFASIIAFIILATNAGSATKIMLGDTRYANLMAIFAFLLITQAVEDFGLIYIKVHQRALLFLLVNLSKFILQLSLNIYFIVYMNLSVAGIVYSACISTGTMSLFAIIYTFYYSGIRFSSSLAKQIIIFSYPLWLAALGTFYIDGAVRYFLRIFSGLDDVGIYSLATKFAMLVIIFIWNPFVNIWSSLRYEIYDMENPNRIYKNIFIILMLAFSLVGLGLSLFSDTVIHVMSDKAYWAAASIVPILVMARIVQAMSQFNNFGILVKGKTGIIAIGTYLNSIIITVAFLILIPLIGLRGAAVSTLIGFLLQLFWIEWRSKNLYNMDLPWRRVMALHLTWLACYLFSWLLPDSLLLSIAGKFIIYISFVLLIFVLPILKKEEKEQILYYTKIALKKGRSLLAPKRSESGL